MVPLKSAYCTHTTTSVHYAGTEKGETYIHTYICMVGGGVVVSGVRRMNEVNARRARLLLGWVTVFGRVYHLGM